MKKKWVIKHVEGHNERIELRKTINGVQLLVVVRKNKPIPEPTCFNYYHPYERKLLREYLEAKDNISISMNGKLWLSWEDLNDLNLNINKAKEILFKD